MGASKNASLHNSKATRLIALRLKHSLPCFCDQAMQKCINLWIVTGLQTSEPLASHYGDEDLTVGRAPFQKVFQMPRKLQEISLGKANGPVREFNVDAAIEN